MSESASNSKECTACHQVKPPTEFHKNKGRADGLSSKCKPCACTATRKYYASNRDACLSKNKARKSIDPEKRRKQGQESYQRNRQKRLEKSKEYRSARREQIQAWSKEYWRKNRDKYRCQRLQRLYGITFEAFQKRLADQGGKCKICRTTVPAGRHGIFVVDHCHKSGKIRGILCNDCNVVLGKMHDSPVLLHRAANYITTGGDI